MIYPSLILSIIEYEFEKQEGFYLILLREGDFISNFDLQCELSVYVKFIILDIYSWCNWS